jgi:hypothetical protein
MKQTDKPHLDYYRNIKTFAQAKEVFTILDLHAKSTINQFLDKNGHIKKPTP